jgi:hypothetical protein
MNEMEIIKPAGQSVSQAGTVFSTRPFSRNDQLQYGVLICAATALLVVARALRPSERGFGTHEQLGLPPCIFLQLTGIPCPSCGLTTSFAHAAHLHWLASLTTQPFGFVAFSLTALSIPGACYLLYRRVAWEQVLYAPATNRVMYALLALYLLSWIYKISVMT